jgi:hypothetical protein
MYPVIVRSLMVVGLVLMALVVALPRQEPPPAFAQEGVCPPNPSPPDPSNPLIIVDTPVPGQRVASPVLISGQASAFEGNLRISILAGGELIVDTFTDAGSLGLEPFSILVPFTVDSEQAGCIRVFDLSPRDGTGNPFTELVQIEVILAPPSTPIPVVTATPTKTPMPMPTKTPVVTAATPTRTPTAVVAATGVRPPSTGDGGMLDPQSADRKLELAGVATGTALVLLGLFLLRRPSA